MKINNIAWDRDKQSECIGCRKNETAWQDGVCSHCTTKAPEYVPYSQIRKFYLLKWRKNE